VATVLAEVGPRVEEWRTVRALLPPEAVVTLSPEPPGEDVRIRHDQWRVLTQVGTSGHSVGSVLDAIGGDPMVGLRTLRDLHAAGLIDLQPLPSVGVLGEAPLPPPPPPPTGADEDGSPSLPPPATMVTRDATPETDDGSIHPERSGGLADVSIMPPPIADDPWAPVAPSGEPEQDGVA
jgi:hypothetical protein